MIGVCIKYFHENYGGMLQAFATISMLEKRGIEYELIRYKKSRTLVTMIKSIPRLLNRVLINDKYEGFLKKRALRIHPHFRVNNEIRMKAFNKFNNTHFTKLSPIFSGYDELCEGSSKYSAIVTGSDQLWSPAGLPTNYYNLNFVPCGIRKISYASSFGVEQIPWYQKKRTAEYLKRIDFISMREDNGCKIVKELTGRNVSTILDPVFMFDKEGWEKLIESQVIIEEPYIFAYFLGRNLEYRKVVYEAAQRLHCKVVTLRHLDQYVPEDEKFGDIALYDVDPGDFLNLIRGARYICTDSFHGTCFSIICEKKFVVFNRYQDNDKKSKNSRIDSLCKNLNIEGRRYSTNEMLANILQLNIDYVNVKKHIMKLMDITNEYLDKAFQGVC